MRGWLPTDTTGWLVLLAAGSNLIVHGIMLTLVIVYKTAVLPRIWKALLVGHLPAVLLLAGAGLSYRRGTPIRGVAVTAGLLALLGEYCYLDPWLGGPLGAAVGSRGAVPTLGVILSDDPRVAYTIAVVALSPAAVGWWQRRREPLAADEDAGDARA